MSIDISSVGNHYSSIDSHALRHTELLRRERCNLFHVIQYEIGYDSYNQTGTIGFNDLLTVAVTWSK